ncbi:MAG: iron chaperone [Candidatus Limnocylindrales bacterium]
MAMRSKVSTIDEYIAEFPAGTQKLLAEVRALIKAAATGATECISYAIPTFDLNGRHLVHFAGYARHIGFYPIPTGMEAFKEELKPYKQGKGSVQFPLEQPLPKDLIRRIVEFRVRENTSRRST